MSYRRILIGGMLRLAGALWMIVFCATLGAQDIHVVSGRVVNSATGQPVAGAQVVLRVSYAIYGFHERESDRPLPGDVARAVTDESGRFAIEFDPSAPPSRLFVAREGFRSQDNQDIATVALRADELSDITVLLRPQSVIRGRVVNRAGEPLAGITVVAIRVEIQDGRRQWRNYSSAVTDGTGEYRLPTLAPGAYYLQAGGSGQSAGQAYGPLFYPAAMEQRQGQE